MASITKHALINAPIEDVWAALRDFGALHERLVPGFVVESHLDGDTRTVTFFNGMVVREQLVSIDDDSRRLVYTVTEGPLLARHHNAAAQVSRDADGRTHFVWITDVLPDQLAPSIDALMDRGIGVIKDTLESATARA